MALAIILQIPLSLPIYFSELANNFYSPSSYFFARLLTSFLICPIFVLTICLPLFYSIQPTDQSPSNLLAFLQACLSISLSGCILGQAASCLFQSEIMCF